MDPKSSIPDLLAIEEFLNNLTRNLTLPSGSIFRIPAVYLHNWGIEITDTNKPFISSRAAISYRNEWSHSGDEVNSAMAEAMKESTYFHEDGTSAMNQMIGSCVVKILLELQEREARDITVCDIGAASAQTTLAVLTHVSHAILEGTLHPKILDQLFFYLLEPSLDRLYEARDAIESHSIWALVGDRKDSRLRYELICSDDETHFPRLGDGVFDIIFSNAVLHHKVFSDYLIQIHRILAPTGALIVGDWYLNLWEYPAHLISVLRVLSANEDQITKFMGFFGVTHADVTRLEGETTESSRLANLMMVDFLQHLAQNFIKVRDRLVNRKLFFLESHESLENRIEKLKHHGFVTDLNHMKQQGGNPFGRFYTNRLRVYEKTDIATVFIAGKKPQKAVR